VTGVKIVSSSSVAISRDRVSVPPSSIDSIGVIGTTVSDSTDPVRSILVRISTSSHVPSDEILAPDESRVSSHTTWVVDILESKDVMIVSVVGVISSREVSTLVIVLVSVISSSARRNAGKSI
jgi:hypothetical protein